MHRLGCPLKEVLLVEKAPILGVLGGERRAEAVIPNSLR